jgi:hypothetical protein
MVILMIAREHVNLTIFVDSSRLKINIQENPLLISRSNRPTPANPLLDEMSLAQFFTICCKFIAYYPVP